MAENSFPSTANTIAPSPSYPPAYTPSYLAYSAATVPSIAAATAAVSISSNPHQYQTMNPIGSYYVDPGTGASYYLDPTTGAMAGYSNYPNYPTSNSPYYATNAWGYQPNTYYSYQQKQQQQQLSPQQNQTTTASYPAYAAPQPQKSTQRPGTRSPFARNYSTSSENNSRQMFKPRDEWDEDSDSDEDSTSYGSVENFGHWEQHTRGIGMKLLQNMGYKQGKGLGKDEAGTTEPVQVELVKPGTSLDFLDEDRAKRVSKKARKLAKSVGLTEESKNLLRKTIKQILDYHNGQVDVATLDQHLKLAENFKIIEEGDRKTVMLKLGKSKEASDPEELQMLVSLDGNIHKTLENVILYTLRGRPYVTIDYLSRNLQMVNITPKMFGRGSLNKLLETLPHLVRCGMVNENNKPKKAVWLASNASSDPAGAVSTTATSGDDAEEEGEASERASDTDSSKLIDSAAPASKEDWERAIALVRKILGQGYAVNLNDLSLAVQAANLAPKRFGFGNLTKMLNAMPSFVELQVVPPNGKFAWIKGSQPNFGQYKNDPNFQLIPTPENTQNAAGSKASSANDGSTGWVAGERALLSAELPAQPQDWDRLRNFLRKVFRDGSKVSLTQLAQRMTKEGFATKKFGARSLTVLIAKFPAIQTELVGTEKFAWLPAGAQI